MTTQEKAAILKTPHLRKCPRCGKWTGQTPEKKLVRHTRMAHMLGMDVSLFCEGSGK